MQSVKRAKIDQGRRKTIPLSDRERSGSRKLEERWVRRERIRSESESVEEDDETVKTRAYLNKGSASGTPRWPLMRPRVARLRKEVVTLKGNT